jgi:DNA-binding PadR family transcriptional regulator
MQAVKYALLGLLSERPRHGYDLKSGFEELLGGAWPLNIGQVYSTLGRLERDGLVSVERVEQAPMPDRKVYSLTIDGKTELERWLRAPSDGVLPLKDELFVKVLVGTRVDGGNPNELIAIERARALQTMSELATLRSDDALDPVTKLIVDGAMLHVEADLRWLELCEDRLGRGRVR